MDRENALELGNETNHHFVRGLVRGYEDYLKVRVKAGQNLEISTGYAYTRGNHLEDRIAKEKSKNIKFEHAKAGSWTYLKFKVQNSGEDYLIIVRRAERINETLQEIKSKTIEKREKNWLYSLSKFNNHLKLDKILENSEMKQLKLYADNSLDEKAIILSENVSLDLEEEFERFYILTYEIDVNTHQLSDVDLMMMDSKTLSMVQIENLREIMIEYQSDISTELFSQAQEVISPLEIAAETVEYDVAVAGEEEDYAIESAENEEEKQEN